MSIDYERYFLSISEFVYRNEWQRLTLGPKDPHLRVLIMQAAWFNLFAHFSSPILPKLSKKNKIDGEPLKVMNVLFTKVGSYSKEFGCFLGFTLTNLLTYSAQGLSSSFLASSLTQRSFTANVCWQKRLTNSSQEIIRVRFNICSYNKHWPKLTELGLFTRCYWWRDQRYSHQNKWRIENRLDLGAVGRR